jgi:hypothetical protein
MHTQEQLRSEANQVRVKFILAGAGLALTFCRIAATCSDGVKTKSNIVCATRAYHALQESITHIDLTTEERQQVADVMHELRSNLLRAGQVLRDGQGALGLD